MPRRRVANATIEEAGASANGSPVARQPCAPILAPATVPSAAAAANDAVSMDVLHGQGAAPARPAIVSGPKQTTSTWHHLSQGPNPDDEAPSVSSPEHALLLAAGGGGVETVRFMLMTGVVDPNVLDERGRTPIMAACGCVRACVETVRLLLKAGGDPTLAAEDGFTPMHAITQHGHTELVGMLHSHSPETIHTPAPDGLNPLFMACYYGQAGVLSRLLSLGAISAGTDRMSCPLTMAVRKGFVGVVRVLVNEGMEAVRVGKALPYALYASVRCGEARILQLLLGAEGEEKRFVWANAGFATKRMLHYGAGFCCPAAVSVLLKAGAKETARDLREGILPRHCVGVDVGLDGDFQMDRGKEVAVRRMLQRGPAYRARSWAWPSGEEEADTGDRGDRDPTTGSAAAGGGGGGGSAAAALSAPPTAKTPVVGVRIFRPTSITNNLFVGTFDRYCRKE